MKTNSQVIAFVGGGKIATALIGGLLKAGHSATDIWVSGSSQPTLKKLETNFGVHTSPDNVTVVPHADVLIFAVKPQVLESVLHQLRALITIRKPLVISLAAGIEETAITSILGETISLIRAMPNTPTLFGLGVTALYAHPTVSLMDKQQAQAIFKSVGNIIWIDQENQMNAISALSGSGPAYFFLFMQALTEAGIALGLPAEMAHQVTIQTAIGAVHMAASSRETFNTLIKQVASPGGGTERALEVLTAGEFKGLIQEAIVTAKRRYEATKMDTH